MAARRKRRLDAELCAQGFFGSTEDALRAVLAGEVSGENRRLTHPGELVVPGCVLHVRGRAPFVSRGGQKLSYALQSFELDVTGLACLDVGCSTGGFTDCLLKAGASSVTAVDVGYAQFDWSLRCDERVTLIERTNVCDLPGRRGVGPFDLAVCDVSFTSVLTVAPAVRALLVDAGTFVTLVKPQFEARRDEVGEGGVVRDADVRTRCVERVAKGLADLGFEVGPCVRSPIEGAKGNVEFLLLARLTS